MIFIKVITTIFLILHGNTLPTLFGGFQNVNIDNNTEMSLYIDYDQLFENETLSFDFEFVDTDSNTTIYNDNLSYEIDAPSMIQSTIGNVLENLPLFTFFLNSENSLLRMPNIEVMMSESGSNVYELYISYYEENGLYDNNIKTSTYLIDIFTPQILDEYFLNYVDIFGGSYSINLENNYVYISYVPSLEIELDFTFTNDLFFEYTVADYVNSYNAYSGYNTYKETIYNEGKNAVLNNPNFYDLYTKLEYDHNYQLGYQNGKLDAEVPVGLNWVKAAINVFFGFLGFMILPGVTLGDIFSGLIILLILKWVLGWFRG